MLTVSDERIHRFESILRTFTVLQVCALAFIGSALVDIKIGDLTRAGHLPLSSDAPGEGVTVQDEDSYRLPDGFEDIDPPLDLDEERTLARDNSASFPGKSAKPSLIMDKCLIPIIQTGSSRSSAGFLPYSKHFQKKAGRLTRRVENLKVSWLHYGR